MAEQSDDSLIREIDDELRQEQFQKVWTRYGKIILVAAGLCVAGVAGYQFWVKHDLESRQALGERFDNAQKQAETGRTDAATAAFDALAQEGGGYGLLARFQAASLLAKGGNLSGAAAAYDAIAGDTAVDKIYRDLAAILSAGVTINAADADLGKIQERLAPLTSGSPWRFSAQELTAAAALRAGDKDKAREIYGALAKDADTPSRMRQRATELLTILR